MDGEEIATCPSCTLTIRVVYDADKLLEANKKANSSDSSTHSTRNAHEFMNDVYKSVDKVAIKGYDRGESKGGESNGGSEYKEYGSSKDEK